MILNLYDRSFGSGFLCYVYFLEVREMDILDELAEKFALTLDSQLCNNSEYLKAIRVLAARRGVPLIDLYADSFAIVAALGEEASRALYMRLEKGEDPRYPDGLADDTHTRLPGAERFARAAAARLRELNLL